MPVQKVTRDLYNKIRQSLRRLAPDSVAVRYRLSMRTVRRIMRAKSYLAYKRILKAENQRVPKAGPFLLHPKEPRYKPDRNDG